MPGVRVLTTERDEAQEVGGEFYFPHRLSIRHKSDKFAMSLAAVELGPLSAGLLGYTGEVSLSTSELTTGYQVNVPLNGPLRTRAGSDEMFASPELAAVYRPDDRTELHGWASGGQLFGLKIAREAFEHVLAGFLGGPVRSPVKLDRSISLASGPGQQWWALTRALFAAIDDPDGPLAKPIVVQPLAHSIVTALLYAVDHPYQEKLRQPSQAACPARLRRALDIIEGEAHLPLTVQEISERVGVSTRALQEGFSRHLGISPMAYLRETRLRRVRADLIEADPSQHTVAEIAHRWGFTHLGRFATAYRSHFGVKPSHTLRDDH